MLHIKCNILLGFEISDLLGVYFMTEFGLVSTPIIYLILHFQDSGANFKVNNQKVRMNFDVYLVITRRDKKHNPDAKSSESRLILLKQRINLRVCCG